MFEQMVNTCWAYIGGEAGAIAVCFGAFFIDAFVPVAPYLLIVIAFSIHPTLSFGLLLVMAAAAGEVLGNSTFYFVCKRFGLPQWVKRIMQKYTDFLFIKGEKLVFINRFVPVMPIVAPFIFVGGWSYWVSMAYIALGSVVKHSAMLILVSVFNYVFEPHYAQWFSLGMLAAIVVVSAVMSRQRSRMKPADAVGG